MTRRKPDHTRPRETGRERIGIVESLGDRGDGVFLSPTTGERYHVAGALPGERVRFREGARKSDGTQGHLLDVLEPSKDRVTPPCPHAALCGGCDLQHLDPAVLATWKREKVTRALGHRGLLGRAPARETLSVGHGTRRRLSVGLRGRKECGVVGFHARATHTLIDTPACLLPTPPLSAALAALRLACPGFLAAGAEGTATLTQTDTGIDLLLKVPNPPDLAAREALAVFADTSDLARLMICVSGDRQAEPVAMRRAPVVSFGAAQVHIPPSPFLQPSVAGEALLLRLVKEALSDVAPNAAVADLFSGLGTFSLPLSQDGYRVSAYDGDGAAIQALSRAGSSLRAQSRDLFRDPLEPAVLTTFDALVLDPPRAGAAAQVRDIALIGEKQPGTIVMVSCAPGTFGRDARSLVDGGYGLDWVQPVDQFTWSHHLELVGRFTRS